jgi:hypothetical protein
MINKDIYWYISTYLPYYEIHKLVLNKKFKNIFNDYYYNYRAKVIYNFDEINSFNDYINLLKNMVIDLKNPDFFHIKSYIKLDREIISRIENELCYTNNLISIHELTNKEVKKGYDKKNYYCYSNAIINRSKTNYSFGIIIYDYNYNHFQLDEYIDSDIFRNNYLSLKVNNPYNIRCENFYLATAKDCIKKNIYDKFNYGSIIVYLDNNPEIYYGEETEYNKIRNIKCIDDIQIKCKKLIFYLSDIEIKRINDIWKYEMKIIIKKMILKK